MFRRLVTTVAALTTFAVVGAQAQFTANFTFGPVGGAFDYASYQGVFNSSTGVTGQVIGTAFQVFCVDEYHLIHSGNTYNVWVTPISSGDFSHTRQVIDFGQTNTSAHDRYFAAAALASSMGASGTEPGNSNLQFAMWDVLGYAGSPPCSGSGTPNAGCEQNQDPDGHYNASTVATDEATFTPAATGISANQWLVITALNLRTNDYQEFIYNGPGRPFETPVPEPATMAMLAMGLVGMAGAGFRRRRK